MKRKNLTAAVLAGLAGAAGIAGTAQAVNINPDGLGQVLLYPYYTVRGGNDTLLSVVNTTEEAKAVKVRFNEGYNSREVLDFNLYLSAYDVWVAAVVSQGDDEMPLMLVPDSSCTVPYIYEQDSDGDGVGEQPFLPFAYDGTNGPFNPPNDGGPTDAGRSQEGYFTMIEMGNLTNDFLDTADNVTHVNTADGPRPADCGALTEHWTYPSGIWTQPAPAGPGLLPGSATDIAISTPAEPHRGLQRRGGLFGGAAIINVNRGTMYSYDAEALQGFDDSENGHLHTICHPGSLAADCDRPHLNDGNRREATVYRGDPVAGAMTLRYPHGVDAVSAVFMKEHIMNEFNVQSDIGANSEWVVTFPTKAYYVDDDRFASLRRLESAWLPDASDPGCGGWTPGDFFPDDVEGPEYGDDPQETNPAWELCTFVEVSTFIGRDPFTSTFNGEACEPVNVDIHVNREESPQDPPGGVPPIVSPPPPPGTGPGGFELCYEVNVIRFGNSDVPADGTEILGTNPDIVHTLSVPDTGNGWTRLDFHINGPAGPIHRDFAGLVGLPVTGFWFEQFANSFLGEDNDVLANYGGIFHHKATVRRQVCPDRPNFPSLAFCGTPRSQ